MKNSPSAIDAKFRDIPRSGVSKLEARVRRFGGAKVPAVIVENNTKCSPEELTDKIRSALASARYSASYGSNEFHHAHPYNPDGFGVTIYQTAGEKYGISFIHADIAPQNVAAMLSICVLSEGTAKYYISRPTDLDRTANDLHVLPAEATRLLFEDDQVDTNYMSEVVGVGEVAEGEAIVMAVGAYHGAKSTVAPRKSKATFVKKGS